jgi:hypothetical protein
MGRPAKNDPKLPEKNKPKWPEKNSQKLPEPGNARRAREAQEDPGGPRGTQEEPGGPKVRGPTQGTQEDPEK